MEEFIENQPTSTVYGLPPAGDLTDVSISQGYDTSCAIRSQEIILRDFGINVPQEVLMQQAEAMGIYDFNGGTSPEDVGKLLEVYGVGVEQYQNANVYNLIDELSAGKRIIVGVDSGELWNPGVGESMEDSFLGERPDHALIVAGIDTTDPNNVQVILTDPGTGHVAKAYPLEQFQDAWNDSGNFMVVTEQSAPVSASGMANFDYNSGHMPIGSTPYEDWCRSYSENFMPPDYISDNSAEWFGKYTALDTNADGISDTFISDSNLDGITDTIQIDTNADGFIDMSGMDINGDGNIDIVAMDSNGDGRMDAMAMDSNGDGRVDSLMTDSDGDGMLDTYSELNLDF